MEYIIIGGALSCFMLGFTVEGKQLYEIYHMAKIAFIYTFCCIGIGWLKVKYSPLYDSYGVGYLDIVLLQFPLRHAIFLGTGYALVIFTLGVFTKYLIRRRNA